MVRKLGLALLDLEFVRGEREFRQEERPGNRRDTLLKTHKGASLFDVGTLTWRASHLFVGVREFHVVHVREWAVEHVPLSIEMPVMKEGLLDMTLGQDVPCEFAQLVPHPVEIKDAELERMSHC